ncbi:MJ0042-type zinc finger domain-containing protein [Blastopirellula marina]|uniref:Zinc finger/thioredoxin putative domain-containing protein n=1 Tax=Blastopirellula marina DSM 3645 TaxID=314230 RepID=A4A228_9BACT|nr:MJ0042-type zinc finger domain-containing protein [Blastopirellula marina]EAQ77199.1 hypothetical protein DSM3645_13193 [Blastopirellula marina DSM 3645]
MSFIASCPHCQAKFAAQDHLAGKNVRCPKCKVPFRIGDVIGKAQKKTAAEREQSRKSKSAFDEDLPVARPAKPAPNKPRAAKSSSAQAGSGTSGSTRPAPPSPSTTPTRYWKEIAQENQPEPPPVPVAAPIPAAAPPHVTPPPEQPIVLSPTLTAAWESLPPIILATARHKAAALPSAPAFQSPSDIDREIEALTAVKMPAGDDDLDDSLLDQPRATATVGRPGAMSPPKQRSAEPAEEVIELGFEDLVVEELEEEIVELSEDDFVDESSSPAIEFDPSDEIITEVEIVEEAPPRRSSAPFSATPGPAVTGQPAAAIETLPAPRSNRQFTMLLLGGAGGLAAILTLIAVVIALSGGSPRDFQPSETFTPTSSIGQFVDPSGRISVRFPQPFRVTPPVSRGHVRVRGAQLVGKSETFSAYYSDTTPGVTPPSGAKPLREHWLAFDLPELADASPAITSIRRHMIGQDYAVEYRLATDIQRDQPGESRVLLIFIQQRMFLLLWSGEEYRDDVDDFFASFSIGDEKFGTREEQ